MTLFTEVPKTKNTEGRGLEPSLVTCLHSNKHYRCFPQFLALRNFAARSYCNRSGTHLRLPHGEPRLPRLSKAGVCKTPSLAGTVHVGLSAEPLLAGAAVLDVLQHFGEHGALQPLLGPRPLQVVVRPGTCGTHRARSQQLPRAGRSHRRSAASGNSEKLFSSSGPGSAVLTTAAWRGKVLDSTPRPSPH